MAQLGHLALLRSNGERRIPRDDGFRGDLPPLWQALPRGAPDRPGRALYRLQVPALPALRPVRARGRTGPGRADGLGLPAAATDMAVAATHATRVRAG